MPRTVSVEIALCVPLKVHYLPAAHISISTLPDKTGRPLGAASQKFPAKTPQSKNSGEFPGHIFTNLSLGARQIGHR